MSRCQPLPLRKRRVTGTPLTLDPAAIERQRAFDDKRDMQRENAERSGSET